MPDRDVRTRYQGIYARHKVGCGTESDGKCSCKPSYFASVYDRDHRRYVKTRRQPTIEAARSARADLIRALHSGELPESGGIRLTEARERFVKAAREGRALNKRGLRYKPRSIDNVEEVLRVHIEPALGAKRLSTIRRGDVQKIVDELTPHMSGSRIRSIVNGLRSLYRWAQDRDLAMHDPAALVRLPAMNATPVERIATPHEFAQLLGALDVNDALPYALAGYGMGRRAQIIRLKWTEVDLKAGALEWGVEWEARKYDASRRVVPLVPQLHTLLKRAYLEQGRPKDGLVCPPTAAWATTGMLNTGWLTKRVKPIWEANKLEPISLQEARHSAATWLDAAGVPPKIASVLMGHATPERQAGAAQITLARYTHALPEDILKARDTLAAYLTENQKARAAR
jgi:integrase